MARARCGVTASRFVGVASKWVPAVPKEGLRCSSTRRLDFMASAINKSRGRWGSDCASLYNRRDARACWLFCRNADAHHASRDPSGAVYRRCRRRGSMLGTLELLASSTTRRLDNACDSSTSATHDASARDEAARPGRPAADRRGSPKRQPSETQPRHTAHHGHTKQDDNARRGLALVPPRQRPEPHGATRGNDGDEARHRQRRGH